MPPGIYTVGAQRKRNGWYMLYTYIYNICLCNPKDLFCYVLQLQPPTLFQQCVMGERLWTPQHRPCEDRPSSFAKHCKQSYIITSPESGVSDIKQVTQMTVLTLLSSKCCEYNVPIILFCSLTRSNLK